MSTQILNNGGNGRHIVDGPLTVAATNEAVPGLIQNAIDRRIVKVRPMSTPIDQLSRCGGARLADSMIVDYYTVDPKSTEAKIASPYAGGTGNRRADGIYTHTLMTDTDLLFEPSETVILPDVTVKRKDGNGEEPAVFYEINRLDAGGLEVMCINAPGAEDGKADVPAIPKDAKIIRMGRAATELDVQTAQFQSLPTKTSNNCQIFK